jgi:hypothetical protein
MRAIEFSTDPPQHSVEKTVTETFAQVELRKLQVKAHVV